MHNLTDFSPHLIQTQILRIILALLDSKIENEKVLEAEKIQTKIDLVTLLIKEAQILLWAISKATVFQVEVPLLNQDHLGEDQALVGVQTDSSKIGLEEVLAIHLHPIDSKLEETKAHLKMENLRDHQITCLLMETKDETKTIIDN